MKSNSITSGLAIALREIFPDVAMYREVVPAQFLQYPHFFINQLTLSSTDERRFYYIWDYLATVRYHVDADPALVTGSLQSSLDDVAVKLMSELDAIYFDDNMIRLTGRRTEKVDGVLHFFCNVRIFAKKEFPEYPLQENIEIKKGTA